MLHCPVADSVRCMHKLGEHVHTTQCTCLYFGISCLGILHKDSEWIAGVS